MAEHDAGTPVETDGGARMNALAGTVRDATGEAVGSGSVVLVPAARVEALRTHEVDLSLAPAAAAADAWDEPLEDLIDADSSLPSAAVSANGRYAFDEVPAGSYFPVFMPSADDADHFPGGDASRTPRAAESLRGAVLDLKVSSRPSDRANYVGSTACLTCHGRHDSLSGAHALTSRVPGLSSPYQDTARAPQLAAALAAFDAGTTLYFYDCALPVGDARACAVREQAPSDASRIGFVARLVRDLSIPLGQPGAYAVDLALDGAAPSVRYPLLLTLGGVLSYQQFITRVTLPNGESTHLVLPFSYQLAGDDTNSSPRDFRWVAYRAEDWLDLTNGQLKAPPLEQAFERQCLGCHATGSELAGDASAGFRGSAAADRDGVLDLDQDGRLEQLTVSCEACHGPGSEHLEQSPRGRAIVSPSRLTPERQVLLCGRCHSNPRGVGGELTPLDVAGRMPRPGLRRRDYLANHVSRVDAASEDLFTSGDSRHARQQYSDFVRSRKHRNPDLLVTCSDCHAPHAESGLARALWNDPSSPAACAECHSETSALAQHTQEVVGFSHDPSLIDPSRLSCTGCHMVKSGLGGAHVKGLLDLSPLARPLQYWTGDRASHLFRFRGRDEAVNQPVAATDGCAFCHGEFLPN